MPCLRIFGRFGRNLKHRGHPWGLKALRKRKRVKTDPRGDEPENLLRLGLTRRHHESDKTVHRGHTSKAGDALIRRAAVEAIGRQAEPAVKAVKDGIIARRGKNVRNIAKVAAARCGQSGRG